MEEIKIILQGYNQEKILIQNLIDKAGNYNSYNQTRVNDLLKRLTVLDTKIDNIVNDLLPIKDK